MEINNEELTKDLEDQYAMLEEEVQEDKKRKRYLILFIFFLFLFLFMFGTTFSYIKLYNDTQNVENQDNVLKKLYVKGYDDAFKYDPNITNYVVVVDEDTTSVDIGYELVDPDDEVEITGNEDLKPGANDVEIVVKDKKGRVRKRHKIIVVVPGTDDDDPSSGGGNNPTDPTNPSNPGGGGNNPTNPTDPSNPGGGGNNPTDPTDPSNPGGGNQGGDKDPDDDDNDKVKKNLDLINIEVSNHSLDREFNPSETAYVVYDILETEDNVTVYFELKDKSNSVELELNDSKVTRKPKLVDGVYSINFDVSTELELGANDFEIHVKDDEGNEKVYHVILVVNKVQPGEDQDEVIEIVVDFGKGNTDGKYIFANVVPGWESPERQTFNIKNDSNYNAKINIKWVEVTNNFQNTNDLEYSLYKGNSLIKTGKLPTSESVMISNLEIPAISNNSYSISYRFLYRDTDQNVDQGKTFSAKLEVSFTE